MPLRSLSAHPEAPRQDRPVALVRKRSQYVRYASAVLGVALAVIVRSPLSPALGTSVPFLTFFPTVVAVSWFGGFGPGLLAAALSVVAAEYFVLEPIGSFQLPGSADRWALSLFLGLNVFISWIVGKLRETSEREQILRLASEQTLVSIGDAVISTDSHGIVTFLNRVAEELTGWPNADAIGRPVAEVFKIVNELTGEPVESPVEKVLREGTTQGLANHTDLISRSGTRVPVDDSGAPIRNREGDIIGTVLVFRDISERRAKERALFESRAQLQQTLDSITDGFIAMNADWRLTYVNPAAERLLGKTSNDLIGRNHWEEYPEARGTAVELSYQQAVREQRPIHFENYYAPLRLWFEINAYPTPDRGLSVYFRDITDRKQAEALARHTEAQLSLLAEANVIGIVFCDVYGKVREANDEYLRIIGYTRSDLNAGRVRWTDVTPPEWLPLDQQKLDEAAERGNSTPYEKEYMRPDGTRVPVYVGFVLLGPKRQDAVAFVLDLSAQKRAESALRESQAQLRRTNEELQQFTYAASHDLKEPLRTVTAYVQLLERQYRDSLDDRGRDLIAFAVDGAKRMQQLVDGLLEYSRAGEVTSKSIAPVRLEHAVESSLSALKIAISEAAAIVTYDELPEVQADALMLTPVLQNLIGNAIKYHRAGQAPRVHITADFNNAFWVVSVRDNGEGIPNEYHDRIFGVFQRLHGHDVSGTGIGLATCKKIVERWGGRIWVESDVGLGSKFSFTIPATADQIARGNTAG